MVNIVPILMVIRYSIWSILCSSLSTDKWRSFLLAKSSSIISVMIWSCISACARENPVSSSCFVYLNMCWAYLSPFVRSSNGIASAENDSIWDSAVVNLIVGWSRIKRMTITVELRCEEHHGSAVADFRRSSLSDQGWRYLKIWTEIARPCRCESTGLFRFVASKSVFS